VTSTYNRRVSLGNLIRARRRQLELEQGEVALRIGVEQQTVSRWENGEARPRLERLKAIARALELSEPELRQAYAADEPVVEVDDRVNRLEEGLAALRDDQRSLRVDLERQLREIVERLQPSDSAPSGTPRRRGSR
jgi:transcriptional regulator with XRE-family HTH domain